MLHLVVNPTAGRGRGLPHLERVVRTLEQAGARVAVTTTVSPADAAAAVAAMAPEATAVAVGGDGTVHAILRACLAHDRRLGVLPFGSGDDFAHALGLGRSDPAAAVRVLLEGRERRIDVATVNGEPFVNAFGSGFDADVANRMRRAPRAYRGLAAYLYGVATALRDFALADAELLLTRPDGALERFAGPALLVAVQ
ncbi:MAG: diacylglycerol kinase family protein, partial [Trueperaceae bacterium]|nr:diacylglycerol kinase family protein [Trueperaceae bacterium]